MTDLVSIGDVSWDTYCLIEPEEADVMCTLKKDDCHICFDFAQKIPTRAITSTVGGNAANAATATARLGLKTELCAVLGQDEPSRQAIIHLEKESVGLSHIHRSGKSNQAVGLIYKGERTIFVHHEKRDYELLKPPAARWLYLTSMAADGAKILKSLANYIEHHNIKVVFNPGTIQIRMGAAHLRPILEQVDVLILNFAEAQAFTGKKSADTSSLLDKMLDLGPQIAIITEGERGATAADGHQKYFCPATKAQKKESTGAGDAYASTLTAALSRGETLAEAMKWASINAASVVEHIGPTEGLLTLVQLQKKLINHSLEVKTL